MLCVIAKIDEKASDYLTKLTSIVTEYNLEPKKIYGHITLVTYLGNNEDEFVKQCKEILKNKHSFEFVYDQIEVLPETSIIVASPSKPSYLDSLHDELMSVETKELDSWSYQWKPHTTLVYHPDFDLNIIAKRMRECFQPFKCYVDCIEFSKVEESGYEIIDKIELKKEMRKK